MKITITGSIGNIGKPLAKQLIASGHEVTIVSSSEDRKKEITAMGATAAIGTVSDQAFLVQAFAGADAVYSMTPPNMGGQNVVINTSEAGKTLAAAVQQSGVKRVVMLSSIGAELASGTGPIAGIHPIEQYFNELEGVAVTILRAGYFYTNFYNDVPLIKGMGIIGSNFSGDTILPLAHPRDIANAIATELTITNAKSKDLQYVISDYRSAADVAKAIGTAIGKPELPWIEFTDEQLLEGMVQAGLPAEIAALYVGMGNALGEGKLQKDFLAAGAPVHGSISLEDFAKEFAAQF